MANHKSVHYQQSSTGPLAAAYLGQAVVQLRRRAHTQLSGLHTRRLLAVADGIETLLPAIERLETVCEVEL